jgi:hypothetical protein
MSVVASRLISISAKVKDRDGLSALVDPGSHLNLMDAVLAKELGIQWKPLLSSMNATGPNGSPMTIYGIAEASMTLLDTKGRVLTQMIPFLVADVRQYPIYLGMPWIQDTNPVMDFHTKELRWRRQNEALQSSFVHVDVELAKEFRKTIRKCESDIYVLHVTSEGVQMPKGLPECYSEYQDVTSADLSTELPQHGPQDLAIELEPGANPPYSPLYNLSMIELAALREYINEYLARGWIRRSRSPAGAPILFAKKKDGALRLCVDYRGLNKLTVKNRHPLPLISESLDRLSHAKWFTRLDIRDAYHRIRVRGGDEWKTAFRTRYGHFEYTVMPFGLTNAPAQFQEYINSALIGLVDVTCIVYLDDILIYSNTEEEHIGHVREVLERLRQNKLFVKLSKCEFHTSRTEFLGYIVSPEGITIDPERVKTIQEWPEPKTIREIRVFIGFMSYYRRFICKFSKKAVPLIILTQKGPGGARGGHAQRKEESQPLDIGEEGRKSFKILKEAFLKVPILAHYDPDRQTKVETDASGGAMSGIISQLCPQGEKKVWRPVDFYSRKFIKEQYNYDVHDKELLAVVQSLLHWSKYLEPLPQPFDLFTDHNNLRYFLTTKSLNQRQTRWSEKLQRFNFRIQYRPGNINPADGPSRRPDYLKEGKIDAQKYNERNVEALRVKLTPNEPRESFAVNTVVLRDILFPDAEEPSFHTLAVHTRSGAGAPKSDSEEESDDEEDFDNETTNSRARVTEADRLPDSGGERRENTPRITVESQDPEEEVVTQSPPESAEMVQMEPQRAIDPKSVLKHLTKDHEKRNALMECHNWPMGGHFGVTRTYYKLKVKYYWENMLQDVKDWIHDCMVCKKAKAPRHAPYGLLNPLPVPDGPWKEVTMDFITDLPPSSYLGQVYDQILVVVDRFSKMAHYIPFKGTWGAKDLAEVWMREIMRLHPTPARIISDRGPIMNSKYWDTFTHYLSSKRVLTTAYHPQTDGQTERQNQTLEQYLRCFCSLEQDDWSMWLSIAEFAYNDSRHAVTTFTPFEMNTGVSTRAIDWPSEPLGTGESALGWGIAAKVMAMQLECRRKLEAANAYQKKYADKRRTKVEFNIGDRVFISTRHIRSLRPKKKLDWKFMGPGNIVAQIGPDVYKVALSTLRGVHPVFHASLLERWDPKGKFNPEEEPAVDTLQGFGDEVRDVKKVLDRRQSPVGTWEYLVQWDGLPETENSWEPGPTVPAEALSQFWRRKGILASRRRRPT